MKINTYKPEIKASFEPVGLNVVFETKDELLTFWALLNTTDTKLMSNTGSYKQIKEAVGRNTSLPWRVGIVSSLFCVVDEQAEHVGAK